MSKLLDMITGLSRPIRESFCSTFGITNAAIGAAIAGDTWDSIPGNRNQFADNALVGTATFAGCTCAFVAPVTAVRAFVWMKNYKVGVATGAAGMTVQLQVATGAGAFTTNQASTGTSVIAIYQMARATCAFYINGVIPDVGNNYQAARLVVLPNPSASQITDAASFDCNIDAT